MAKKWDEAPRHLKRLQRDKGDFTLIQQIALDIESTYKLQDKKLSAKQLREDLFLEIDERWKADKEVAKELKEYVPSIQIISKWRNLKTWEPAIYGTIKDTGLFTIEKKAKIIDTIYQKAIAESRPDINAAKLWLTMSGDFAEGGVNKQDDAMDLFREINSAIFKNKEFEQDEN